MRRLSRSCRKLTTRTFAGCHSGSRTIDALVDHARSCGDSVPAVVRLRDEGAVSKRSASILTASDLAEQVVLGHRDEHVHGFTERECRWHIDADRDAQLSPKWPAA